jgi:hypothetical protein
MSKQKAPKLLDQVRHKIRYLHYSRKTEQSYTQWIKRCSGQPISDTLLSVFS